MVDMRSIGLLDDLSPAQQEARRQSVIDGLLGLSGIVTEPIMALSDVGGMMFDEDLYLQSQLDPQYVGDKIGNMNLNVSLPTKAIGAAKAVDPNMLMAGGNFSDEEIAEFVRLTRESPFFRDANASKLTAKNQKLLERDPYKFSDDTLSTRPMSDLSPVLDMSQNKILRSHKPASIEDLQNQAIVYAQGDVTRGGGLLTGVDDVVFDEPVKMQAGKNYGLLVPDDDFGWASGQSITSSYDAKMKKALQEYGEDTPVNLMYTTMGTTGGDFALHTSETFAELVKKAKISKADVNAIDEYVKKVIDPDFVGIKSKKLRSYLGKMKGGKRGALLKALDKQGFYDAGLPHIGEVRYAVAEPELIGVPSFMSGASFFRMNPNAPAEYRPDLHSSYEYSVPKLGGMMKLDQHIPAPLIFPDGYRELATHNKSGKPAGISQKQYGLDMKKPYQLIDQEVVDNVMRYNELLGR